MAANNIRPLVVATPLDRLHDAPMGGDSRFATETAAVIGAAERYFGWVVEPAV